MRPQTAQDGVAPIVLASMEGETGAQAEAALGGAHEGAVEPMHDSGGMPQLDPATFAPQLIWLALTFGVLYLLMSRVALPRVAQALETRRDRIANDLDQAAQFKAETDAAIEGYETALAEARAKAHQIAAETREELGREVDTHRLKLEAELDAKLGAAEARIGSMKSQAMLSVRGIAADVAAAVMDRLGLAGDADRIGRAVDTELDRRAEGR